MPKEEPIVEAAVEPATEVVAEAAPAEVTPAEVTPAEVTPAEEPAPPSGPRASLAALRAELAAFRQR